MDYYYKQGNQINDYSIVKFLGEGRYGIVYLAKDPSGKKCVIKQLKKEMLRQSHDKLFYEPQILKQLDSPYFPKFIEKFNTEHAEGYILEYKSGKVFDDMIAIKHHHFNRPQIYKIASKLLALIEILDENGIVHRDIRLPNVLLSPNHEVVLIDFGLARYIDNRRYFRDMDYWYFADFLVHLYYTSYYTPTGEAEKPWYAELDLTYHEKYFLMKLMGLKGYYTNFKQVKEDFFTLFYH